MSKHWMIQFQSSKANGGVSRTRFSSQRGDQLINRVVQIHTQCIIRFLLCHAPKEF